MSPDNVDARPRAQVSEYKSSEKSKEVEISDRKREGGSPPPPVISQFDRELNTMFRRELLAVKGDLQSALEQAKGPKARAELKQRLRKVNARLIGGDLPADPEQPAPAAAAPKLSVPETAAATDEELLGAARYWLEAGKPEKLTARMRQLADAAGLGVAV